MVTELAKSELLQMLKSVEDYRVRSLLELLLLAHEPFKKAIIWNLFRDLGVIHILVISGSHIHGFVKALRLQLAFLGRLLGMNSSIGLEAIVGSGIVFLVVMTDFQVALVRAALCWWSRYLAPAKASEGHVLFYAFAAHGLVFPNHIFLPGFYLSWICFLLVLWCEREKIPLLGRVLLLTFLSQLVIWKMGLDKWPNFQVFSLYTLSNILLVWIFEVFVFQFISQILAAVFVCSMFGEWSLMCGVEILRWTLLPAIIFGAKMACLAAELLKTL